MKKSPESIGCHYDYANKCDCAEDDKCGCDYPNNLPHDYTSECLESENTATTASFINTDFSPSLKTASFLHAKNTPLLPGTQAPDFTAPALLGDNTLIEHFNFYKYLGSSPAVLFFYPEDFAFTCPPELLLLNREHEAFKQRNAKILGISTDSIYTHLSWKQLSPEKDGISDLTFPLIADLDKKISASFGILNKKETAMRATVIIDQNKTIRHISLNDDKLWRSPEEAIRIIDILNQKSDDFPSCPKGWKQNFLYERPETQNITEMLTPNDDNIF